MAGYYGAYVNEPSNRHVICHNIRVEEYTRTLPNGKTITVRGYSRQGQSAINPYAMATKATRKTINTAFDAKARNYASNGRNNAAAAVAKARNSDYRGSLGSARESVKNYAGAAGTRINQFGYNAGNAISDFASDASEITKVGIGNFMEQVRYGAAYAGAAVSEGAKRVAAAAKKAYDAGKSFIERLFGKVKEIAGNVGKAATNAYNSASKAVSGAYNSASKAVSGAYNGAKKAVTDFVDQRRRR